MMSGSVEALNDLGDEVLAGLLVKESSRYDLSAVRAMVAGVLAAAADVDADAWCRLVVDAPSPALIAALQGLKARMAAEAAARPEPSMAARLAAVRSGLRDLGVDAFIFSTADEYQNEYVPACNRRLTWLTGFTGSAGSAVLFADQAALFVDGRYTIQVREQVDGALYRFLHLIEEPPEQWLKTVLKQGQVLGYDAWLHTPVQVARLKAAAEAVGAAVKAVDWNPVDRAWTTRPAQPLGAVVAHEIAFAGQGAVEKRTEIAAKLEAAGTHAVVLTAVDSIAWLLNIRGGDVDNTPLPLSYAVLRADGLVDLFIDHRKLMPGVESHLGNHVAIRSPDSLGPCLDGLAGKRVQLDFNSAAAWIADRLGAAGATLINAPDPVQLPKAIKNETELAGTRRAHLRDGAAMVGFLHWFATVADGTTRPSEIEISDRLEQFRAAGERFRGLSFPSISASGPSAALPHYHAEPEAQRRLDRDTFYLIDSGGQYLDGTTDITRTIAVGTVSDEMKDRYTRVLKGHIAIATARFPVGTTGAQLDTLARMPLWQAGVTYDHGTGHGVGSFLGVHEGPASISQRPITQPLLPGMILSNEPGYYKPGAFGIRIENLVVVCPVEIAGAERPMLGFETVTFCPIDTRPVDPALLSVEELDWLNGYHAAVREKLLPMIADAAARDWLIQATAPLSHA